MLGWLSWVLHFLSIRGKKQSKSVARPPMQRGPRKSREERAAELKPLFKEISERNRQRMLDSGITRYRWSSSRDQRVCVHCAENDGKIFDLREPTKHGFPGQVECCNGQACRCLMTPLI